MHVLEPSIVEMIIHLISCTLGHLHSIDLLRSNCWLGHMVNQDIRYVLEVGGRSET